MTTSLKIIHLLREHGPMTVQQIAIVMCKHPSTIQRAVQGLCKRNIVAIARKEHNKLTSKKPRYLWDIRSRVQNPNP